METTTTQHEEALARLRERAEQLADIAGALDALYDAKGHGDIRSYYYLEAQSAHESARDAEDALQAYLLDTQESGQ